MRVGRRFINRVRFTKKKKMIGFRGRWVVKNLCDLSYFFSGEDRICVAGCRERGL